MARNVPSFSFAPAKRSTPTFIRTFCGSMRFMDPVDVSWQQLRLSAGFSAGSYCTNLSAVLEGNHGGILDPGGLAAIFPIPEFVGLFYLERFTGEGSGYAPHQFTGPTRRSITRHWSRHLEAVVVKNGGYIKYMGSQQINTRQSAFSRTTNCFNKRWRPILWKKTLQSTIHRPTLYTTLISSIPWSHFENHTAVAMKSLHTYC